MNVGVVGLGNLGTAVAYLLAEKLYVPVPLAKGVWGVINGRNSAERFIYAFIKDLVE